MDITIKNTNHGKGMNRCVYRGPDLIATISHEKPNRANGRVAAWNVCRLTGRVDWFDTYSEARDDALKG